MEVGLRHRHVDVAGAVHVVRDTHRDALAPAEHVELGEHEVGDAVDARGVASDDGVVPAASAGPPGRGAELRAVAAQPLAVVIEQLGRERPRADARRVGLDDGDDPVDARRRDAGARARAAGRRVGRRDERIGAVVDVELRRLAALEQHGAALVERPAEHQRRVGHHRAQAVGVTEELLHHLVDGDGAAVVDLHEQVVLLVEGAFDLLAQDLLVEQVLHAHPDAGDLVGVRRPDAAPGGAEPGLAEEALGDLVDHRVVGRDQVSAAADEQPRRVHASRVERVELLEENTEVDDDAVADDGRDAGCQDPRGQQVQGVLLVADHDGVAGVVAAVVLHDVVDGGAEDVGRLALALVPPLGAEQHDRGHVGYTFSTAATPARDTSYRA